ncbi:DUF6572 domain-containing protein [Terriglobus tenax]|uniref:DUF6572 domain-containing protein n=1 Tax=Terriglobus tenax TaxID=1111115 RepID=UPI0021DF771B|nr:DUF6572 domain-containing protein [Terriglobus tenax]
MAVDEPNKVDQVSVTEDGAYVLTIKDHWDWVVDFDHVQVLEDKLNAYLGFIESGEMAEHYPASQQLPTEIDIHFEFAPSELGLQFLEAAKQTIESGGYKLTWNIATQANA